MESEYQEELVAPDMDEMEVALALKAKALKLRITANRLDAAADEWAEKFYVRQNVEIALPPSEPAKV